jgi:hypothetical protein
MYADPRHLHDKEVKIRLNAEQHHDLIITAQQMGAQPAALARELLSEALAELLQAHHKRKSA